MSTDFTHIFASASEIYAGIGFSGRVGFGSRAAVLHIDLANAWTRPGSPMYCDGVEAILEACAELNHNAHLASVPVFYVTTGYDHIAETGHWLKKIPALKALTNNPDLMKIDDRIRPTERDIVFVKKRASAFPGTDLETSLRRMAIDTLILTGVTASCCVRHTAEDAIMLGFRPIIVREAVGDRIPGSVDYNLFDIDAKFGDVVCSNTVNEYLHELTNLQRKQVQ